MSNTNREAFEAWAVAHGGLDLTMHEAMDNEKLPFMCTYYNYTTEIAWRAFANKKEPAQAALAQANINEQSQAQQPTDISKQLREYAADSGYSHNDYADTMLAAASEIERLTASQAQQESQWISVEERLPEENCHLLVACEGGNVATTFYATDHSFFDHAHGYKLSRKVHGKYSKHFELARQYGYRITHWMPLPPAPMNEVNKPEGE